MAQRVLVTGANGFVGTSTCSYLQERGWAVIGVVRRPEAVRRLPRGVEGVVVGDIGPDTDWRQALRHVKAVVHLAAHVHRLHEQASNSIVEYRRVNVEGTRCLLDACSKVGVQRFLYMSSVKAVVGEGSPSYGRSFVETDVCDPVDPYGISKCEAENLVLGVGRQLGIEAVVLRPPLVYGPGVGANFGRLLDVVYRGWPLPLGGVRNARSMVYLGNLIDAIEVALRERAAAGQVFFIADDEALSTAQLIRRLANLLDSKAHLFSIPYSVLHCGALLIGRRAEVERLTSSLVVDTSKAKRLLAWKPPYSVDEGLRATVRWYCHSV